MAQAFNLTAQINLQAPSNLKTVVAQIRREFATVSADVKVNVSPQSAKSISGITSRLDAMNASLIQAKNNTNALDAALRNLSGSLSSVQSNASKTNSAVSKTSMSVSQTATNIKVATTEMEEFGKQSALAVRRFAAFSVVTSGIFALINAVNSGFKAFVAFDQELVKLQQVTGKGALGLSSLEKEITGLAISLGVSSKGLIEVASTLAQAGLSAEDTRIALSALAKTELAPSFDSLTDTTEGAIAAMRQFGIESKDLEKALGSINAVAAAFAVESKDIIAAIQRTGGVFAASSRGVSEGTDALNEFIAVFTSIRQTTRESAETIATGLRTIFTRVQRAKTIDQLREFGVELTDLEGKFVGPFEAVKRLSGALSQLDPRDLRFSSIVEELGGFRQIGKVIPLIQQFATAQQALSVAQKGQGSLYDAQITAQKSLANQLAKVREQFLALIRDVGKSQSFQALFKIVTGLASGLISLASAFKPILPILAIIGAVKGISAIRQFGSGFMGGISKGGGARGVGSNMGETLSGAKEKEKDDTTARASDAIRENTSALRLLTDATNKLTDRIGSLPKGGPTLNSGGIVRKFATGGLVPGSGDEDSIPAKLTPGEFVMRKSAVRSIGVGNLSRMNMGGEPVQKFMAGSATIRGVKRRSQQQEIRNKAWNTQAPIIVDVNDKSIQASHVGRNFGTLEQTEVSKYVTLPVGRGARSKKFDPIQTMSSPMTASETFKLGLPEIANQNMKRGKPGVTSPSLINWIRKNSDLLFQGRGSIPLSTLESSPQMFADSFANSLDSLNTTVLFDSSLSQAFESVRSQLSSKYLEARSGKVDLFSKPASEERTQIRHEGFHIKKISDRFLKGGMVKKFMAGGVADESTSMTLENAKKKSRKEIIDILASRPGGISKTEKAVKVGSGEIYRILGQRNPDAATESFKEAILKEYVKTYNRKTGSSQAQLDRMAKQGLVVAAAGMFGKKFSDTTETIESPSLSSAVKVRIMSGVLGPKTAASVESIFAKGTEELTDKGAETLLISDILEKFGLGRELNLDFDRTLATGADEILSDPGSPVFSEFSDRDKVQGALQKAKLTALGEAVAASVKERPELLGSTKIVTARPDSTLDLVQSWLSSQGLPIPLSQFKGFGGVGVKGDDIAKLKAAFLSPGSLFVDDDERNINAASLRKDVTSYRYGMSKSLSNNQAEGDMQGLLLEQIIQKLGGPGAAKGFGFDFPKGLGPAAKFFDLPDDIPTDVKRTINGPSTITDNIVTYLKNVMGYNSGGTVRKFAKAGKVDFGTGTTEFPKRISNAYEREIRDAELKKASEKIFNNTYSSPKNEIMSIDADRVREAHDKPFDKKRFLSTFTGKIKRDSLYQDMADFTKLIGLPSENIDLALPEIIDFIPNFSRLGQFDRTGMTSRGVESLDVSGAGFTKPQEQDLYGYKKLIEEKVKEINKIIKTPVNTYPDGSFSHDTEAAKAVWYELDAARKNYAEVSSLKSKASEQTIQDIQGKAAKTGRGSISVKTSGFLRSSSDGGDSSTLYHEMTHQLINGLRTRNAESFTKYKERVSQLFTGDNDDLSDSFDALNSNYSSADVVYGKAYKISSLNQIISSNKKKEGDSNPDQYLDALGLWSKSLPIKKAREFKPLNPDINQTLLNNGLKQSYIDRIEDSGKEEFLTTLVQNANKLDGVLSSTLDATLNELLGNAGIQRQSYSVGGLADSTDQMQGLMKGLYGNRKPSEEVPAKKEKNYGKIALRSDGSAINASYYKNDQREGYVSAYKMRDYLYYVGLSKATQGYGPKLYDTVMEEATSKGAMLTSDRSSVSGAAKKVWEYYFKNRGDVKKTPLKPDDWTRNQAAIDPKLYGKPETWPAPTDPAWILQSGYSKSPSLINDKNSVIRMGDNANSGAMALQYFSRKARGGRLGFETGGTVPALVSNGEAYIPPKVAKRIGYGKLNRMNQADRNGMSGFSNGGISIFKGPGSGTSDSIPTNLPVGSFIIREKATKALGLNKGGSVGIQKFVGGSPGGVSNLPPAATPVAGGVVGVSEKILQAILAEVSAKENNGGGQELINTIKDTIADQALGVKSASEAIVAVAAGIRKLAIEKRASGNEDRAQSLKRIFDSLDKLQQGRGGSPLLEATNDKLGITKPKVTSAVDDTEETDWEAVRVALSTPSEDNLGSKGGELQEKQFRLKSLDAKRSATTDPEEQKKITEEMTALNKEIKKVTDEFGNVETEVSDLSKDVEATRAELKERVKKYLEILKPGKAFSDKDVDTTTDEVLRTGGTANTNFGKVNLGSSEQGQKAIVSVQSAESNLNRAKERKTELFGDLDRSVSPLTGKKEIGDLTKIPVSDFVSQKQTELAAEKTKQNDLKTKASTSDDKENILLNDQIKQSSLRIDALNQAIDGAKQAYEDANSSVEVAAKEVKEASQAEAAAQSKIEAANQALVDALRAKIKTWDSLSDETKMAAIDEVSRTGNLSTKKGDLNFGSEFEQLQAADVEVAAAGKNKEKAQSKLDEARQAKETLDPTPPPTAPTPVNPKILAEEQEYMKEKAQKAGMSVGGYKYSMAQKLGKNQFDVQREINLGRQETKSLAVGKARELRGVDIDDATREGATSDEAKRVQDIVSQFAAKLQEADPSLGAGEARKAAIDLAKGLSDGTKSVEQIVEANGQLKESLNGTIDPLKVMEESVRRTALEMGVSKGMIEDNVSKKQVEQQAFINSEEGKRFGGLAEFAPGMLQSFSKTKAGGALASGADFISGKGGKASKLFAKAGGIAGIGTGVAVAADQAKQFLPVSMQKDPNVQGALGALGGAGSGAASGAMLGMQVAGPVGALIAGIGGAVIGGIDGWFAGKNQQVLVNALDGITKSSGDLDAAFKKLDQSSNKVNFGGAQKAFGDLLVNSQKITDIAFAEGPTAGSMTSAGATGAAGGAAIGALIGSVVPILGTALGAAAGAAIGGIGGAYADYRSKPTMAERQEALQSSISTAGSQQEAASRLAEKSLQSTSTEGLDEIIKNLDKGISSANPITKQYAESLAKSTGKGIEEVAVQAKQRASLDAFMQARKQAGATDEAIAKEIQKNEAAARKEGEAINNANALLISKQQILARATKEVAVATENLLDVYRRVNANIQRYESELDQTISNMDGMLGNLGGNSKVPSVNRQNEQVLGNLSAYSSAEVKAAADNTAGLLGGTPGAQDLANNASAAKVLQDQLPAMLRNVEGNQDKSVVVDQLREMLPKSGAIDQALKEIGDKITNNSTTDGKDIGTLIDEIDSGILSKFSQTAQEGANTLKNLAQTYSNTLQRAVDLQNDYNKVIMESNGYMRKAQTIRINAELDLAQALGKNPTLKEMNKAFDTEVTSLTSGLVGTGDISQDQASDPFSIARGIMDASARNENIRLDNVSLQNSAGGLTNSPDDQKARKDLNNKQLENIQLMGQNNVAIEESRQALEKLANDGSKAANALSKIQERQQLGENARGLGRKLLTSDSGELADFKRQMDAYTKVSAGKASNKELGSLQVRRDAFAGLDNLKGLIPESVSKQMEAKLQREMIMADPRGQEILNSKVGFGADGEPITMDQALSMTEEGKDPVQERYIAEYKKATEDQAMANEALGLLTEQNALIIQDTMLGLQEFLNNKFPGILENALTSARADSQVKPEVKTKDKKEKEATQKSQQELADRQKVLSSEAEALEQERFAAQEQADAGGRGSAQAGVRAQNLQAERDKKIEEYKNNQETISQNDEKLKGFENTPVAEAKTETAVRQSTQKNAQNTTETVDQSVSKERSQVQEKRRIAQEKFDTSVAKKKSQSEKEQNYAGKKTESATSANTQIRTLAKVQLTTKELQDKGKLRVGEDGMPTGRSPEEESKLKETLALKYGARAKGAALVADRKKVKAGEMSEEDYKVKLAEYNSMKDKIAEQQNGASAGGMIAGATQPSVQTNTRLEEMLGPEGAARAREQALAAARGEFPAQNQQSTVGLQSGPVPTSVSTQQIAQSSSSPESTSKSEGGMSATGYTITLDETSRQFLETFNTTLNSFGGYVDKLAGIKFPDEIKMVGNHVVDVRISGAAAFDGLKKDFTNMIQVEVSKKMNMIWKQSGGKLGETANNTDSSSGSQG